MGLPPLVEPTALWFPPELPDSWPSFSTGRVRVSRVAWLAVSRELCHSSHLITHKALCFCRPKLLFHITPGLRAAGRKWSGRSPEVQAETRGGTHALGFLTIPSFYHHCQCLGPSPWEVGVLWTGPGLSQPPSQPSTMSPGAGVKPPSVLTPTEPHQENRST